MGTEFKAASGRTINIGNDGSLLFGRANGYLSRETAFDAEEYFQAKRDEELGRWRYPLDPSMVVYPSKNGKSVMVVDEWVGVGFAFFRAEVWELAVSKRACAAQAYFKAHPEPKPWHDAQAGEFWVVTHTGMQDTCRVDDVNGVPHFFGVDNWGTNVTMPVTHHSITAAQRLVAEVPA